MIVVPALTFFRDDKSLDLVANQEYASILAESSHNLLLFGTTGEGSRLTPDERLRLFEIYQGIEPNSLTVVVPHDFPEDQLEQFTGEVHLMHSPWPNDDRKALATFLRGSQRDWMSYSHPSATPLPLDAELARFLNDVDALPSGAKVSKVSSEELAEIRTIVGQDFRLWHGTDRDISASFEAGADAVVSQTLGSIPLLGEERSGPDLQRVLDELRPPSQGKLERLKSLARQRMRSGQAVVRR